MSSQLFSTFKMRGLELANRIVVSPMGQYSAENGSATDWHIMHLGHLSLSGTGLLITEATAVEEPGRLSKTDSVSTATRTRQRSRALSRFAANMAAPNLEVSFITAAARARFQPLGKVKKP
jgi:2,4-dienoyl-CoA reductase-like NADH-dependent reductase (Old Yellow Enzyme family)